ncbi:MAG TPA: DNA-processing protein DprA [Chitinophagaceae bacterium]|nr:DNA-processing protein DprA [Chitinophagaceae bacterium]
MTTDLLYQIALTLIPTIGPVQAKSLIDRFGDARSIFSARHSLLRSLEGIGEIRAGSIKSFTGFHLAEMEMKFLETYNITPLFLTDPRYPQRLLNCVDSPTLLYFKGDADLNWSKIVAIVGTRKNTTYGKQQTEKLVAALATHGVMIISGLAYGIDALAHKAALANKLPTVGVMAHGLDQVYPSQHTLLAKEMIAGNGGLLTEFRRGTNPDRYNFPSRNRIVAGMCDATIVIETGVRGGSMITAELANGYNRDVFAFPGKVTDLKSAGCNHLIRNNKAVLISDAQELLELMNWTGQKKMRPRVQTQLFVDLSREERAIVAMLEGKDAMHIDEINQRSGLSCSTVAAAILNMELQGILFCRPGKLYSLL